MKKYLWKERFVLDAPEDIDAGWAALIDEKDIVRALYNGERFILINESKEQFLERCRAVSEHTEAQELAARDGEVPVYLFSNDNKTIVTHVGVFENYDEMIKNFPNDSRCAVSEDGHILKWEPPQELVEEFLVDDIKNITNGTTHVFFYAAKVKEDKILLMRHSIFQMMDGGKLLTQSQFEKICKENNLINPWQ